MNVVAQFIGEQSTRTNKKKHEILDETWCLMLCHLAFCVTIVSLVNSLSNYLKTNSVVQIGPEKTREKQNRWNFGFFWQNGHHFQNDILLLERPIQLSVFWCKNGALGQFDREKWAKGCRKTWNFGQNLILQSQVCKSRFLSISRTDCLAWTKA